MNNMWKVLTRANQIQTLLNSSRLFSSNVCSNGKFYGRSLWHITNRTQVAPCSCPTLFISKGAHSKVVAETELVEFLTSEIIEERKAQKVKTIPTELDGFKAHLNGAEVTLTKKSNEEIINIIFNVNHSVDTDVEPEVHPNQDQPELGQLRSKPIFRVEIIRGDTTLSLSCSFISPDGQEDNYIDVFGIDEISLYDGKCGETTYAVSGEVLDSHLYDLIMNLLEEKGISNEFVEKLSEYSTTYEHSAYIGLLEGLSKFASKKSN